MNNDHKPDEKSHLFSADRPIRSRKDDRLGRRPYAEAIANAIQEWTGNDSLVIALYGPWGSGKSSIKNMIGETLSESKTENRPDILEFNPWQLAGSGQLSAAFFLEVGKVLGRLDTSEKGRQLAAKWRVYASSLNLGTSVVSGIRNLILVVLLVLLFLGLSGSLIPSTAPIPFGVLTILAALGLIFEGFTGWARRLSDWYKTRAEANQKTLPELKKELSDLLLGRTRSLLIIMDDVDRLDDKEIQTLLQLVKANADLPNLVYILAFERELVEGSLAEVTSGSGREFLEKIVQAGFDIPVIERKHIERVLFGGLDELLSAQSVARGFNQYRWGNVYVGGLGSYFTSLRDVHRFLSTLAFHFRLFSNTDAFEVNPVDLIAIEVLRTFEPDVYGQLPRAKSYLTDGPGHHSLTGTSEDQVKEAIEGIVTLAPENRQPWVREILKRLFPHVERFYGGSSYHSGIEGDWVQELLVCSKDVFDRYFVLGIPEGDLSQADLERVLSLSGDRQGLVRELGTLQDGGLLVTALERLHAHAEKIPLQHARSFVTALFDRGDELPEETRGLTSISPDQRAGYLIFGYLRRQTDQEIREQVIGTAIEETTGLYMPVMTVSWAEAPEDRQKDPRERLVGDSVIQTLKDLCVQKIRRAADDGRLATHRELQYLLLRWRDWADQDEPSSWAANLIKDRNGLLSLLTAFSRQVGSARMGDHVSKIRWEISLEVLEYFVPVEIVEAELAEQSLENIGEHQQAIRAFEKAVRRRRDGAQDRGPRWRDRETDDD